MPGQEDTRSRTLGGYRFLFVSAISPALDDAGIIAEYSYNFPSSVRLNPYASGPFCRFKLKGSPAEPGVYAISVSGNVKYIGECENLSTRFARNGYGYIDARNCHSDGQATNCKINSRILAAAQEGADVSLWFYKTVRRKIVEAELIDKLDPLWNGRGAKGTPAVRFQRSGAPKALTRDLFRRAVEREFEKAMAAGQTVVRICAGELHHALGGYPGPRHRMPACCSAMKSLMGSRDRVLVSPPSGKGASLLIEYRLPRAKLAPTA